MGTSARIPETRKAAESLQALLFHDTLLDAISTAALAAGGIAKAANALWPNEPLSRTESRLRDSLNPNRDAKLSPEEVMRLAQLAKEQGDHSIMNYLAAALGYEVRAIDPEDQRAALMREYIDSVKRQEQLAKRLQAIR